MPELVAPLLAGLLLVPSPASPARRIDRGYSRQTAYVSGRADIDRLQDFLKPTLDANRKEFRGQLGTIKGFGAGAVYPQIWLRDSATIVPLSRYHYPAEYFTTWLEEHLAYQQPDGQLYDWIAPGDPSRFREWAPEAREVFASRAVTISADKNTTEADQEASAVGAVHQVYRITGSRAWLEKRIGGQAVLDRCARALQYLLDRKLDRERRLVVSALTADWGDVSPAHPDQRAIYADPRTPLVVGLYTNALLYRAARQLAELYRSGPDAERAAHWERLAAAVKSRVNERLWREADGFFRMHAVVTPGLLGRVGADEGIFALGGNGLAVLSGLADDRQARTIFRVAEVRRRRFGVSTIAGVLVPPFPRGFFSHPAVAREWEYQNGGQWDWFAGRFLLAEFERGYSEEATTQLAEIAKKAAANEGLHEWHTRDGAGKGSAAYSGSAGALGEAVFQGLFGIYLTADALELRVRLGDGPCEIHLYQPATDTYLAYQYSADAKAQRIRLSYESNHPRPGRIAVRLPKGMRAVELRRDGRGQAFSSETVGEDTFAAFPTDWKPHAVEIHLAPGTGPAPSPQAQRPSPRSSIQSVPRDPGASMASSMWK